MLDFRMVFVVMLGWEILVVAETCTLPDTKLTAPEECTVTWKADEADALTNGTFQNCFFSKQHIIATLPNGVDWEIWENPNETDSEGNPTNTFELGKATFFNVGGAYRAEWNNSGDFISRAGLQFEKIHPTEANKMRKGCTYTKYGKMTADYRFTKIQQDGNKTAGGYSYVGIYGWARNPLVEFYIIDDWFGNEQLLAAQFPVPPTVVCHDVYYNLCKIGEYNLDDGTYVLYSKTRGPAYSINGPNQCFTQIYAVRKTTRQCGTIHIDEHFAEWAKSPYCLVLNEMYEAKILVESGGGEGWIEFTHLNVTKEKECNEGELFNVGSYPSDTYACPLPGELPNNPNEQYGQLKYVAQCKCPEVTGNTTGGGAGKLWNRKAWVTMVVLWIVFFLSL